MSTTGFIGLGRMGRAMASNLIVKGGFDLIVYDIAQQPVEALKQLGARAAASIAEVAQSSEIILTMLPSSIEVEATILGSGGLLANGREGQLIVDMSTID